MNELAIRMEEEMLEHGESGPNLPSHVSNDRVTRSQVNTAIVLLILILAAVGTLAAITVQPAWSIKHEATGPRYSDRIREFRRALWRIASYTETGLNIMKHSELVAEANFERNAAMLDLSESDKNSESWKSLTACLESFKEAGAAWKSQTEAGQFLGAGFEEKRQAAWTKAGELLIKAEQQVRDGK